MSNKIILRFLTFGLLVSLAFNFVLADNHDSGVSFDSGTSNPGHETGDGWWIGESEDFSTYIVENPSVAFDVYPNSAWSKIYNDPSLINDPDIRAVAFDNDPLKSSVVLNQNIELLNDPDVLADFDKALVSAGKDDLASGEDTQYKMLNLNPEVKTKWLNDKFGLSMEDDAVGIKNYDGEKMTSEGDFGVTFDSSVVNGMRVNKDGSLSPVKEVGGQLVKYGGTFSGGELYLGEDGQLTSKDGLVELVPGTKDDFSVSVVGGSLYGQRKNVVGLEHRPVYTGMFTYVAGEEGEFVEGFFAVQGQDLTVDGSYFSPYDSTEDQFVLIGNTDLYFDDGITVINIKAKEDSLVYYTQENIRRAGNFCVEGSSCIVNTPSDNWNSKYYDRLSFVGVSNGDDIKMRSPNYYSHAEVIGLEEGTVQFQSVDDNGVVLGAIQVKEKDDILVYGNDMSKFKTGRVDVMYEEEGEQILHHWSSNEHQKDSGYFKSSSSMVTCTVGSDCEKKFAQSFGKVIRDGDADPKTTVVFSGDNAYTARNLESWCKNNGGCYVVNSRDVPPTTSSENLVVTGHHWADSNYVWRDSEEVNIGRGDEHNPIDKLYFADLAGSSPFDQLPASDNVNSIAFSACNTVVEGGYSGINKLGNYYDNLETVQGWDGTAPLYERVGDPSKSLSDISASREVTYTNTKGERSVRAHYLQKGDEWIYTTDGKTCFDFLGQEVSCE